MLEQTEHHDKQPDWYAEEIARIAGLEFAFLHKSELDALQARLHKETGAKPTMEALKVDLKAAIKARAEGMQQIARDMIFASLKQFARDHFVVHIGGKVRYGHWETEPDEFGGERDVLVLQDRNDLLQAWEHKQINGPDGRPGNSVAVEWLHFGARLEFRGLTMDAKRVGMPIEVGGRPYLNLWRGWGVEPMPGDTSLFTDYVEEVLAAGDPVIAKYILDWLAWVVQHPDKRIEVALALVGKPGSGKGTLGNLMVRLFGSHGQRVGRKEEVVGAFNDHLRSCCLLFADEALFAGDKAAADALKGIITEAQLQYNGKFIPLKRGKNHISPIFATNHDWALTIEVGDRRYVMVRISPCRKGDVAYWKRLHAFLDSETGRAAVLDLLLNRYIKGFNATRDRPNTEIYRAQIESSLQPDERWWYRVALPDLMSKDPKLTGLFRPVKGEPLEVDKAKVFKAYEQWFDGQGGLHPATKSVQTSFWMRAWEWLKPAEVFETRNGRVYTLHIPDIDRVSAQLEEHLFGVNSPQLPTYGP